MKTLFVAPQVPWPLNVGSKIRTYNLLRSYAELGPVTLVCFSQDASDAQAVKALASTAQSIHCIPFPQDAASSGGKLGALRQALQRLPKVVRQFSSAELTALVHGLLAGEAFDVLHVERLFMADNVVSLKGPRASAASLLKVLDVDDLESAKAWRLAQTLSGSSPRKYLNILEYIKLRRYESRVLQHFHLALVCSREDRDLLAKSTPVADVEVFCNGADIEDLQTAAGADDARTLVFFGALDYQPNHDAALYLAQAIFPQIRSAVPGVKLLIAGKSPAPELQSLHNGRDIIVSGYVEDKRALFAASTVIVVPIRIGGGTRIKILEAMAAGWPVVSTTVGCEGIDVTPRVDILVGDSPAQFAAACIELLRDEGARRRIGAAGQELMVRSYRWEKIRQDFMASVRNRLHGLSPAAAA